MRVGETVVDALSKRSAKVLRIATMDGDLQNDPADLPAFVAASRDHDSVCGVRQQRRASRFRRSPSPPASAWRSIA